MNGLSASQFSAQAQSGSWSGNVAGASPSYGMGNRMGTFAASQAMTPGGMNPNLGRQTLTPTGGVVDFTGASAVSHGMNGVHGTNYTPSFSPHSRYNPANMGR